MLVFCKECATLMDPPSASEDFIACHVCHASVDAKEFESVEIKTSSRPAAFPHRPKKSIEVGDTALIDGATVDESCPNPECDSEQMVFHTAQLRSADEGQTVFYNCHKCGYKYSINS